MFETAGVTSMDMSVVVPTSLSAHPAIIMTRNANRNPVRCKTLFI
jgi:hypothetical protein